NTVALQLPIGQESDFHGVVDLLTMKGIYYKDDDKRGSTYDAVEIPDDLKDKAQEFRAELVEKVAETDDALMEKFLNEEEISVEELKDAIRKATIRNDMVPVICGSSYKNKGVQPMLDAVVEYLRSPLDVPPIVGEDPVTGEPMSRRRSADDRFAALAFKMVSNKFE